ncbi:hypothetical protein Cha6605_3567 [Chamaesiphon minutus PCC 6605]|uniref:Uncharacterized protein n=1 Tax=Chamaesiphon minutus (strain ATCC 27169 / PCC 6605) TaxID=1173020 RepID=K9UJC2_CHAP6|nr:hypothetical protein Cha6605_3567 [Chamaesiphon minutus PCC 6605]
MNYPYQGFHGLHHLLIIHGISNTEIAACGAKFAVLTRFPLDKQRRARIAYAD